jgi:predicted metal-dependent phosphotriesterase family hydrolase
LQGNHLSKHVSTPSVVMSLSFEQKAFSVAPTYAHCAVSLCSDVKFVVDCTLPRHGRDAAGLAEVSRRSGVHIVMAASCSSAAAINTSTSSSSSMQLSDSEALGRDLERQLMYGIEVSDANSTSSKIPCGVIVVALDGASEERPASSTNAACRALTARECTELQAAAFAHSTAGAPLLVQLPPFESALSTQVLDALAAAASHSSNSSSSEAAAAAAAAAALLSRVVLCNVHSGSPLAEHLALLQRGVVLSFDTFGRAYTDARADVEWPTDTACAARVAALVAEGYSEQLLCGARVSQRIHLSR